MTPAAPASPALCAFIFVVALLYSSVGHGGASGYLAALSLFGYPLAQMKASALLLNLLVAAVSFLSYWEAGHFEKRLFWPFAAASIPLAFLGGFVQVSPRTYSLLLAATLVFASWRLMIRDGAEVQAVFRPPALRAALGVGGGIGLLSGAVGVGGGIFLSPLMILFGWADAKRTAAVSAAFIWANSAAGLFGQLSGEAGGALSLWPLAAAALLGGLLGSRLGARRLSILSLRRLLGAVLLIASYRLAAAAVHL